MSKTFFPELSDYIAIVCHDAGATNLLIPIITHLPPKNLNVFVRGPAKDLWKQTYPKMKFSDSFETAIHKADKLVSGTGWASNLEHNARKYALKNNIYSIAIVDHWANYEERFSRNNEKIYPDEIWVFDKYAFREAIKQFPTKKIKLKPNIYLEDQVRLIKTHKRVLPKEVLYILGPVRNNWGREINGEFQALDFFVNNLNKYEIPKDIKICLRLHPSEMKNKYHNWMTQNSNLNVIIDNKNSLAESIGRATWVVGCESYGLILALKAKKIVLSTLPPWAHRCRLPHEGIIHLRDL